MLVIGHRGAAGHEVENSIKSIKKGISFDVDYIEIDVQRTKDNKIIVFHDKRLNRLTNYSKTIFDYTFKELKDNVTLSNGESLPLLSEVCKIIAESNKKLFIEIKSINIEKEVIDIANRYLSKNNYIIGSFFHKAILKVKQIDNSINTLALLEGGLIDITPIIDDTNCDYIGMGYQFIDGDIVDSIHKQNKKIFLWTVNYVDDIKKAIELNVDGIISNYPDRVKNILNKKI